MAGNDDIALAEQAITRARALGDTDSLQAALNHLGMTQAAYGLSVDAATSFEEAAEAARIAHQRDGEAKALANAGAMLQQAQLLDEALIATNDALRAFEDVNEPASEVRALANASVIHYALGDKAEAGRRAEQGLEIARDVSDREMLVTLHAMLAELAEEDELPDVAHTHHLQAVAAARGLGNEAALAERLEKLGAQAINAGNAAAALPVYFEVQKLCRNLGDSAGSYRASLQLGVVYQHQEKWAEARASLEEARVMCRALGDETTQPFIDATLANVLLGQGDATAALGIATAAVTGYRSTGDAVGLGRSLSTLGRVHENLGSASESTSAWNEALQILEPIDPEGADGVKELLGV